MSDYRNVWALIVAVSLLQLAGGILGVVTPLGLEALGVDAPGIGLIAALYAGGFMAGAWLAPNAIATMGNIRVFSAASAVAAAGTILMALEPNTWVWTAIRLLQGASFAWMFASAEAWMSSATPAHARGGVLGFYHVMAKAALMVGPFIIAGAAALSPDPYLWCAFFLALALVPVCITRRGEPPRSGNRAMGPIALLKVTPAAVYGCFLAGVINSGTMALLPVFAREIAPEGIEGGATGAAALAMAAAWLGGLVSQWPVGKISDHMDRRVVVAGMGVAAAISAGVIGFLLPQLSFWLVLGVLGIWGAGSLSFYGVAVAHGVDRANPSEIAPLMSGLLFVWAFGSVLGPPIAGFAVTTEYGVAGLFIFAAALSLVLVLAMLWRRSARRSVPEAERASWEIANPTSTQSAEIDPRTDAL